MPSLFSGVTQGGLADDRDWQYRAKSGMPRLGICDSDKEEQRRQQRGSVSLFDRYWTRGQREWVRTERRPGRGMEWMDDKPARTLLAEAKRWVEGKIYIAKSKPL